MAELEVMRRLLRADEPQDRERPGRMTPARVLRTSMARAADTSVGLVLTVLGVAEDCVSVEEAVSRAEVSSLFVGLTRAGDTVGFVALDGETRSALVESQTLGHLREASDTGRPYSASDVELCRPLIDALLREIRCLADDTTLEQWTIGVSSGPRLSGARAVGLALEEATYRVVRMTLDFGVAERSGEVVVCLPRSRARPDAEAAAPRPSEEFARHFRASVLDAPARLMAVLHRMILPVNQVEDLRAGQVVPLSGVTVASVRVEGPDGAMVLHGRLGQVAGLRAVRLEQRTKADLGDVPLEGPRTPGIAAPAGLPATAQGPTATEATRIVENADDTTPGP